MNCPHCGAEPSNIPGVPVFECLTYCDDTSDIGTTCYERQISRLRAELAQCVRRDDPRLSVCRNTAAQIMESIPPARYQNGSTLHPSVVAQADYIQRKLQSIIEGK